MENKPLVSIAMATYNGEEFLREQLDSILRQTYPNLEIVITDDRSTDSTPAILDEYAARHANIRVYHNEENLGFRLNFEKALSLTRGDFIALADQDDVWMPEKIATLMDNLGDNMLVYCDSAYIDREGKPLGRNYSSHRKLISGSNLFLFDEDSGFGISGHANLFRREVLDRAVPIDPHFFHDHWIALHAMIAGTVDYVPDRLVGYRQHSRNVAGGLGIHLIPRVPPLTREERR